MNLGIAYWPGYRDLNWCWGYRSLSGIGPIVQHGYLVLATTTRHWGQYGAPLKEVERVTSVMLECSYSKGGAYDWRFSLSGAMDFDSAMNSGTQAPLLGNNKGVMLTVSKTWKML